LWWRIGDIVRCRLWFFGRSMAIEILRHIIWCRNIWSRWTLFLVYTNLVKTKPLLLLLVLMLLLINHRFRAYDCSINLRSTQQIR
jgi:hypothetical protein